MALTENVGFNKMKSLMTTRMWDENVGFKSGRHLLLNFSERRLAKRRAVRSFLAFHRENKRFRYRYVV